MSRKWNWQQEAPITQEDIDSVVVPPTTTTTATDVELARISAELVPFYSEVWNDSEFHQSTRARWLPKGKEELDHVRPKIHHMHISGRTGFLATGKGLPTIFLDGINGKETIPIEERTEPLFIVCSPTPNTFRGTPNPMTTLENFDCCEDCDKYKGTKDAFQYLFCAFPVPYRDLPEVPEDTKDLPRSAIHILCLECLHGRFARVSGYRITRHINGWGIQRLLEIVTLNYLPYRYMFGINLFEALIVESAPDKWRVNLGPGIARTPTPIPILTGFYTLSNFGPRTKNARN